MKVGHLFCFGLGYSCARFGVRLKEMGWKVSGTVRTEEKRKILLEKEFGDVWLFSDNESISDPIKAFSGVTHVVCSIPPGLDGDPALLRHRGDLQNAADLKWVGYLSTPAVYGDRGGALVSEVDAPNPGSLRGRRRLSAEQGWIAAFSESVVDVQIFRLSGIYGPGRNALDQLRNGRARIIEKPGQVFNRIHVDDIGAVLIASMSRPRHGGIYNVADHEASASGDVIKFAASLLEVDPPRPIPFRDADLSQMARSFYSECKRLDTSRLRDELGVNLQYPNYREGLSEIFKNSKTFF